VAGVQPAAPIERRAAIARVRWHAPLVTLHVLYAGADRFVAALVPKLGGLAQEAFARLTDADLARIAALPVPVALLRERVAARLASCPIEDFRIDFEDGYGLRPHDEEDRDADEAGRRIAEGERAGTLPPFLGVRLAPLEPGSRARALRTLDRVLAAMVAGGGARPLRITLPKVSSRAEVEALARELAAAERTHGLPAGSLGIELMLEHPRALLDERGAVPIRGLVEAGEGRVLSCHLGTYDLTAALGVPGWAQRPDHPVAATARTLALLALAGTGVRFYDGATTRLPLPVVRAPRSNADHAANHEAIVGAMAEHAAHVRRALSEGIEAGWDLHPAQIPARLVAVHASYLAEHGSMGERLLRLVDRQARATATGTAFDDAATGRALVSFFERGRAVGALTDADLEAAGVARAPAAWRS